MQKKFLVKEASVLLILALLVPSISAIASNRTPFQTTATLETTWYVPDDFPTIQEAVDSDLVEDGDTVFVKSGNYVESVQISKSINLIGENKETTIIAGVPGEGSAVQVLSFDFGFTVTISGFTLTSSSEEEYTGGFLVEQYSKVTISDNIITKTAGSGLIGASDCTISENTFTDMSGDYACVWLLYFCRGNTINDNIFINNDCAVWISHGSSKNNVFDNTITNSNEYGIVLSSSGNTIGGDNDALKNVLENNPIGIYVHSGAYLKSTLEKNNVFIDNEIDIQGGLSRGRTIQLSSYPLLFRLIDRFPILGRMITLPILSRLINLR